jgi:AraC-like DNA-binding protein
MHDGQGLRYVERSAPRSIADFVECAWRVEAESPPGSEPHRVLPDGCVELIVQLRGRAIERRAGSVESLQPEIRVVGQLERFMLLEPQDRSHSVGVRLRPAAAGPFLGVGAGEITGRTLEAGSVFGDRRVRALRAAAESREPLGSMLDLCERWLRDSPKPPDSVVSAVGMILASRGSVRLAEVHRRLGVHGRTLQRRFRAAVGLRPKQLARIARLQSVLLGLRRGGSATLTEIALASGYADQAHLTREFKKLTGYTPGVWRQRSHAFADLFTGNDRLLGMLTRPSRR